MTLEEKRREPRDEEEAAAFKGLGDVITILRGERNMSRNELASKCEMTRTELERIEHGEFDEWWGGIRLLAKELGRSADALMIEAEESAAGSRSGKGQQSSKEEESKKPVSKERFRIVREKVFPRGW